MSLSRKRLALFRKRYQAVMEVVDLRNGKRSNVR